MCACSGGHLDIDLEIAARHNQGSQFRSGTGNI